jgi:hypothetical protein
MIMSLILPVTRKKPDEDPHVLLEREKARLERTIETLSKRLEEVRKELAGGG